MGSCFSSIPKVKLPLCCGVKSKEHKKEWSSSNSSVSKASSISSVYPTPRTEDEILQSSNLKSLCFNELKRATGNFRQCSMVGEGGFGRVFKGWIDQNSFTATKPGSGMIIAVKKLNQEGSQGHQEWLAEINYLGQLHHPNLVKLIGYCLENEDQLLVYEFMSRGSLDNHLFGRSSFMQPLTWNLRMKVALDTARGLAYLHSNEVKVIHRDLKSSNILLDSDYNAKLSDFGMAKDGPAGSDTHVSTRCIGTYGYVAPEYMATGHLNTRSEVYSFGVILLELLCGRRALDRDRPTREQNLASWAKPFLKGKSKVVKILDVRVDGQYPLKEALKVSKLAFQCLSEDPKCRPTMIEVVTVLEQLQDSNLPDCLFADSSK